MRNLRLTLETAAANLALDEALLEAAEAQPLSDSASSRAAALARPSGILRLWEPQQYFVVLGRSSQSQQEVALATCARDGVPLLRRTSGGATIVAGPGCLMYALVLGYGEIGQGQRIPGSEDHGSRVPHHEAYPDRPFQPLLDINATHRFVLGRIAQSLSSLAPGIVQAGISDLALPACRLPCGETGLYKFSGNSLRCKRTHYLYHGTLLYDFDLPRISRWLKTPPRQPDYRSARPHATFLANLPATQDQLVLALTRDWHALQPLDDWPRERTARLVREKYQVVT